jgi:hypothetical protein
METAVYQTLPALGTLVLRLTAAVVVLLVGWVISKWISGLVGKLIHKTDLDNRTSSWAGDEQVPPVEESISKIVYYVLMVFVLMLFFEVLGLTIITEPLNALLAGLFAYMPSLLAALILGVAAWIVATILRGLTRRVMESASLDRRLSEQGGPEKPVLSKSLSEAVYWLVWLVFLPPILEALGMTSLVAPIIAMFNEVLGYLPNIFAAVAIVVVGWFVAKIIQRIVTSFLAAVGTDDFSERIGLNKALGKQTLSNLLGLILFILILLPVVIAGLEALGLDSLTAPLSAMLESAFNAIPAILAAFVILVGAYIIGKLVGDLAASLLEGLGFDKILVTLGLSREPVEGRTTPSQIAGTVTMIAIVLLAALSASSLLGFPALTLVITHFVGFAWNIIIGLMIFGIGLWLAGLVAGAIETSDLSQSRLVALFARVAVVTLATAMALGQMGLADSIVNLAFGLTLGAVAVAIALAFGLGGREIAGRELEGWVAAMHEEEAPSAPELGETEA